MAFMYYLSSRQLVAWVVAASSEEDPEILGRKFSVKFKNYSNIDFACRVFIVLLTLSFAVSNVLNRIKGKKMFVAMTTEFGILVCFQVGVIWLLIYSFHSFKRCTRMIEDMNSRVLNLQLLMMCLILVAGLLLQIGSYVVQLDPDSIHQSENLVGIVSQVLFTASLWIGLYTFYLFVTQPYNSALNRSFQRSSQIGDKLAPS